MLNLVAFITPKPTHFGRCKQLLQGILQQTRQEQGCIRFELYETNQSERLVLVETFIDQDALDFHYAQPYTVEVFAQYEGALLCEPTIHTMGDALPAL